MGELAPAVTRVVDDESYRARAEEIAAAMRDLPDVDSVVDVLAELAER
jgi:UDP:flavonoid glycosyltransferase YjiC (YdhE family)